MKKFIKNLLFIVLFLLLTSCTPADNGKRASLGNSNAKILIEEFSDFQCPACAAISPELEKLVIRNSNIARLDYYHFPLNYHEYAFKAAEAAECANDQGKFWEFMNMAF